MYPILIIHSALIILRDMPHTKNLAALRSMFPNCEILVDSSGQVVIHTHMEYKDGKYISMSKCPHCDIAYVKSGEEMCQGCNNFFDEVSERMAWEAEMMEGEEDENWVRG